MRSAVARFVNHSLRVRVPLRDNFLVTRLGLGQLLPDFFGVDLALLDFASAFLQYRKDRFVSEALQKECNNAEANHLRQKQLPIPAKRFSCFAKDVGYASTAGGNY